MGAHLGAPVDDLGEADLDELDADVALRVVHRAQKGAILVDALEHDLNVAVEQPRLDEVARLTRERRRLLRAVLCAAEPAALDTRKHQRHLVERLQEQHADRRAVGHLLDDGILRGALDLLQEAGRVKRPGPLDVTDGGVRAGGVVDTEARHLGGGSCLG